MAEQTIFPDNEMGGLLPTSPLDMWTLRKLGKFAADVEDADQDELIGHILESADDDVDFWEERNMRFMESQRYWEIGGHRKGSLISADTKAQITGMTDSGSPSGEVIELNDGYLIVDKITSMVAGAYWGLDVPPATPDLDDTAQDIEDFLRWHDREMESK